VHGALQRWIAYWMQAVPATVDGDRAGAQRKELGVSRSVSRIAVAVNGP